MPDLILGHQRTQLVGYNLKKKSLKVTEREIIEKHLNSSNEMERDERNTKSKTQTGETHLCQLCGSSISEHTHFHTFFFSKCDESHPDFVSGVLALRSNFKISKY